MWPSSTERRCGGFSLIEVLAAFVVLTLVVLGVFRLFSGALGNASAADEYSRALLLAESRMSLAIVEKPLRESREGGVGDDGRFRWEVAISPYEPPRTEAQAAQPAPVMPVRLWAVASTVTWPGPFGRERSVMLSTLRLGAAE